MSDDSSSSVDNVGLLSRDRWGGSWPAWIKSQLLVSHRGTSSLQFSDSDLEQGVQGGPVGVGVGTQGKPGRSRHARYAMSLIILARKIMFLNNHNTQIARVQN